MKPIRITIIEDERYAAESLLDLLQHTTQPVEVLAVLESVRLAVEWFQQHPLPDLILADIQLSDGLSFQIFERINLDVPVVFTTAFDSYAIRAFQLNSIHYLLKPLEPAALQAALDKFSRNRETTSTPEWQQLIEQLKPPPSWRSRFAVQQGASLFYVDTNDIAYLEGDDRYVMLVTREGKRYIIDYLLRDLEQMLDPKLFFRLNRTFIARITAIDGVNVLSKSRLSVRLKPAAKVEVIVSAASSAAFRGWLNA